MKILKKNTITKLFFELKNSVLSSILYIVQPPKAFRRICQRRETQKGVKQENITFAAKQRANQKRLRLRQLERIR